MGNDKHVYACHKVTGMLFVATAELSGLHRLAIGVNEVATRLNTE